MKQLQTASGLVENVSAAFSEREFPEVDDPDRMLYQGGFFGPNDKTLMEQVREASPNKLKQFEGRFEDSRLDEMLFRYRARNFLDTLSEDERQRWNSYRKERWCGSEDVEEKIETLMETSDDNCLVDLRTYVDEIRCGVYE